VSHTDKTRPFWVQLMDPYNRGWKTEHHWDHHVNGCTIEQFNPVEHGIWHHPGCVYWPSDVAAHNGIYSRPGGWITAYAKEDERHRRNTSRMMCRSLRYMSAEEREDFEDVVYPPRHGAIWDAL
jgi:hypothetical protein